MILTERGHAKDVDPDRLGWMVTKRTRAASCIVYSTLMSLCSPPYKPQSVNSVLSMREEDADCVSYRIVKGNVKL